MLNKDSPDSLVRQLCNPKITFDDAVSCFKLECGKPGLARALGKDS